MKKVEQKQPHMSNMAALLLFALFAVSMLFALLTGAGVYRRLVDRDQQAYEERTARQYLAARVRQSDSEGAVKVGTFTGENGDDTLFLLQDIDGETYMSRIYVYEGYLYELFSSGEAELCPEDGEKVLAAEGVTFTYDEGERLLHVRVENESGSEELLLHLRSGKGDPQ